MTDELDPRLVLDLWEYSSGGLQRIDARAIAEDAAQTGRRMWTDPLRVWERLGTPVSDGRPVRTWLAVGLTGLVMAGLALRLIAPSEGTGGLAAPTSTPTPSPTSRPTISLPSLTLPSMSSLAHRAVAGDVDFSYRVPDPPYAGHEWGPVDGLGLSKGLGGEPQGAQAIIYWAGFPDDPIAGPCLPGAVEHASSAEIVDAIASTPGTDLVEAPGRTTVGGYRAAHVVVAVREDTGCDPGFLYRWPQQETGVTWRATAPGDIVRVWVVEVGSRLIFVVAETHPGLTERGLARLEVEIQAIVGSIQFE